MGIFFKMLDRFNEPVRVLDIGGTAILWRDNPPPKRCHITLLNLSVEGTNDLSNVAAIQGDARKLMFSDASFDICFSNSVIEHVGTLYDQIAMANEIKRVSKAYFVQTPNRYFPLEPHFLVPFWQFMPKYFRAWLLQQTKIGWASRFDDPLKARAEVEQIRLISIKEMRALFPGAVLYQEKIGPLTKSIVAYGYSESYETHE